MKGPDSQLATVPSSLSAASTCNSAQGTAVGNVQLQPGHCRQLQDLDKVTFAASSRSYLLKMAGRGAAAPRPASAQLSVQEKRKLLWGAKRGAGSADAASWAGASSAALGDEERQQRFLQMVGAKKQRRAPGEDEGELGDGEEAANAAAGGAAAAAAQAALSPTLEAQFEQARGFGGRRL